jgi:hypothetical protein
MDHKFIRVRPVLYDEEERFKRLLSQYHYLGFLPKIGETIWYIATYNTEWIALLVFSAAALKCKVRDQWIGWDYRHQFHQLKGVINNSRFLILPAGNRPNVGSKVMSLCLKRVTRDWPKRFGHSVYLAETFVDPERYHGTVYRASNWRCLGRTRGYRRVNGGYTASRVGSSKLVFVKPLHKKAQWILSRPIPTQSLNGSQQMTITADQMRALPDFFRRITDPRRAEGKRHQLSTVLSLAAGAVLCGARGYKAMADWVSHLGQKARARFNCTYKDGTYIVPSETIIRNVLIRVNPEELDTAISEWNACYGVEDDSLAIDGKTMKNSIDENGRQTHILSAIGHTSKQCYTQKK